MISLANCAAFMKATASPGIFIVMIQELKESYEQVSSQDTSAPIMQNTQTVYAGLTYGKTSLNVDLSDQGTHRGFRV